ncbi:ribonuclease Z [Paraclostridium bifermentans]|uniref:ribonuclease Z n=1 Tax=Paraclostridium TaxID=1849822 RepID=UPI00038C7652|nr:ribonuclease Z [Paraclostridium bifermentans]MDV8115409.1 ribonuclease Z [Bacillus sp. BAU-SS-2023]EQK47004.1 ribonuclease Z [[Clostridium] bifermentans ATCC 19299] [Paraclostridium bifermentans ATCC 19299]MCE9676941.1 ribonuclease Z [Paraclostridium bifermentans]MCR1874609.1 ribonuclease Z [Paraclostridium bifermentans]TQO57624.1 ribonuclease Z [Paraclostridium bifermentans]
MVEITLLGCGGSMPVPNRYLSSLLINYRGRKILIDCGEGTQVSMKIANCGFKTIDYICITHLHGDHIIGLPGILSTIGNCGRTEMLTIIGPKGIKEVIDAFRLIVRELPYDINIIENPKEDILVSNNYINKDIIISTLEVEHSTPCIAYSFYIKRKAKFDMEKAMKNNVPKILWSKLQNGREIKLEGNIYTKDMVLGQPRKGIKVSFVTDTRPIKEIMDFVDNSDLLVCEGMYGDDCDLERAIKNKHMTFRESATIAKQSNVETMVLTHFSPIIKDPNMYIENAMEVFENTIIGTDRLKLNLLFKE